MGVGMRIDFASGTARLVVLKIFRINAVKRLEVAFHIYQKDGHINQLVPAAAAGFKYRFYIGKNTVYLGSKSKALKLPLWSNSKPGTPLSLASLPAVLGPTPLKNNRLPTLRAWGYKPTGFGAEEVFILLLI
jgi:hypothetical protein